VIGAELHVYGLLQHALLRPLETYVQNHTTQLDMVPTMKEYEALLKKLMLVEKLTSSDGARFPELPWCGDGSVLHSAGMKKEVVHKQTLARWKVALDIVISPPGLSEERNATQLRLMVVILTNMATGMLKKLEGLMDPKYGGLFQLSPADLEASELNLIPATSDMIERYFGMASWINTRNPNLTRQNMAFRLSMRETKVGSKLIKLYLQNPARVSRMVYRARQFREEFVVLMNKRKDKVLAERIQEYEVARADRLRLDAINAAELAKMQAEARMWKHAPLSHPAQRRTNSTFKRAATVDSIESLVEQAKCEKGTMKQKEGFAQKMLVRWLTVMHHVHGLSKVAELNGVFFSPTSQRLSIKTEGGVDKPVQTLAENLAKCSAYLERHGSPAGFAAPVPETNEEPAAGPVANK
jgi:hypothetical protein